MHEHTIQPGTRLVFKEKGVWARVTAVKVVVPVIEDKSQADTVLVQVDFVVYGPDGAPMREGKDTPLQTIMSAIDKGAIVEIHQPTGGQ